MSKLFQYNGKEWVEISKNGENYVLTEADKREIASKIKVPIVEKIVEKTEVIHETPIVTEVVKEVAVTDSPTQIADKLNTLEGALDIKVLKDLPSFDDFLKQLKDPKNTNRLDISDIKNWNQPARGKLDQRWHGAGGSSGGSERLWIFKVDSPSMTVVTGDGQAFDYADPLFNGWRITSATAAVTTVSSSGTITIQMRNATQSVDLFSTALTIDANEKNSSTAATPVVINTSNNTLTSYDEWFVDIDGAGTSARGLTIHLTIEPA